jgi:hypothetical protein
MRRLINGLRPTRPDVARVGGGGWAGDGAMGDPPYEEVDSTLRDFL